MSGWYWSWLKFNPIVTSLALVSIQPIRLSKIWHQELNATSEKYFLSWCSQCLHLHHHIVNWPLYILVLLYSYIGLIFLLILTLFVVSCLGCFTIDCLFLLFQVSWSPRSSSGALSHRHRICWVPDWVAGHWCNGSTAGVPHHCNTCNEDHFCKQINLCCSMLVCVCIYMW